MLTPHQEQARKFAVYLRYRGKNPLPSRMDRKQPWLDRYAHLWDEPAPESLFTPEGWPPTTNLQTICGTRWRLMVLDLDGPAAIEEWERLCRGRWCPDTWISHSGGGGQHWWFTLPKGWTDPLPKCFLWKGENDHEAIERFGDRSLIMTPPSVHPTTGREYIWLDRKHSPKAYRLGIPAVVPDWVLRLRPVESSVATKGPFQPVVNPGHRRASTPAPDGERLDRDEILDRIRDKIGLASRWGVRFTGKPGYNGWVPCKAIDREDRNPSAAVHAETGVYTDLGSGTRLSFFDLAMALGVARDFQDAIRVLRDSV